MYFMQRFASMLHTIIVTPINFVSKFFARHIMAYNTIMVFVSSYMVYIGYMTGNTLMTVLWCINTPTFCALIYLLRKRRAARREYMADRIDYVWDSIDVKN